jgi:hypothetical protein
MIGGGVDFVAEIEHAFFAQWSHFGRWPRGELHDEHGLLWFETPIRHLPYNGVIRTRIGQRASAATTISTVMERFRARDVQFVWVVHPSASPTDLGDRLAAHGLAPVERMTCMSLELAHCEPSAPAENVAVHEVVSDDAMKSYTDLTARYWEIPDQERELVAEFHRHWGPVGLPDSATWPSRTARRSERRTCHSPGRPAWPRSTACLSNRRRVVAASLAG